MIKSKSIIKLSFVFYNTTNIICYSFPNDLHDATYKKVIKI